MSTQAMFTKALLGLGAVVAAGSVLLTSTDSQAYPDAKVEAQLRPDFGLLLKPPVRHHKRYKPWHGHGYRRPTWGYGPNAGPGFGWDGGPGRDVAFVDCAMARDPNAVNRALSSLKPGGTLILRAQGAACLDNVVVTKPVTIQADGGAPYRATRLGFERGRGRREILDETVSIPATLKSRPGGPCIEVDVSPSLQGEVVLRNMVLEATDAGDESCLYVHNSHVRLERTVIRYAGEGSALYVDGGSVTATDDVRFDANTYGQAVYVEDAFVDFDAVTITRAAVGLQIEPSGKQPSRVRHSAMFLWPSQSPAFGAASSGIVVPGSRQQGQLVVEDTIICGFGIGVWVEGANTVDVTDSKICRVSKGVVAAGGQVTLANNWIGSKLIGLQIGAGRTILRGNRFYGVDSYEVYLEPGAVDPVVEGNEFQSSSRYGCSWRNVDGGYWGGGRQPRWGSKYRDRMYQPHADGRWGQCREPSYDQYFDVEQQYGYDDGYGFYGQARWPEPRRRVYGPTNRFDYSHERDYRDGRMTGEDIWPPQPGGRY